MENNCTFGEVVITEEQLKQRIKELGAQISKDYEGEEILVIGILKGAVLFLSDLIREITVDPKIDFMAVTSYGASTKTSGVVRILKDLDTGIEDLNVIIVEDIIDSGITLHYLKIGRASCRERV
jgi:hypoxanthine phosphoribosyltransferase